MIKLLLETSACFMMSISDNTQADVIEAFIYTSR